MLAIKSDNENIIKKAVLSTIILLGIFVFILSQEEL
jgi:hypothetical protein